MSFKIVGIGEVLWDLLPAGPQLGGAPANFAYHARALGASAKVVTRIGSDALGRELLRRFGEMGIDNDTVQLDETVPTGTAAVRLENGGVPQFIIQDNVAWDHLMLTAEARKAIQAANAVCFGSLAQRSKPAAAVIQKLVAATSAEALRVFDINLRQHFYTREVIEQSLLLANVLKLNDQELVVLEKMFELNGGAKQQLEQLANRFGLRLVALTRGQQGSLLYQTGNWSDLPGSSVQIVDTIGAGDSFTAALVMGVLGGMTLDQIHHTAADVADFVCSNTGATPSLPESFRLKFALHEQNGAVVKPHVCTE